MESPLWSISKETAVYTICSVWTNFARLARKRPLSKTAQPRGDSFQNQCLSQRVTHFWAQFKGKNCTLLTSKLYQLMVKMTLLLLVSAWCQFCARKISWSPASTPTTSKNSNHWKTFSKIPPSSLSTSKSQPCLFSDLRMSFLPSFLTWRPSENAVLPPKKSSSNTIHSTSKSNSHRRTLSKIVYSKCTFSRKCLRRMLCDLEDWCLRNHSIRLHSIQVNVAIKRRWISRLEAGNRQTLCDLQIRLERRAGETRSHTEFQHSKCWIQNFIRKSRNRRRLWRIQSFCLWGI